MFNQLRASAGRPSGARRPANLGVRTGWARAALVSTWPVCPATAPGRGSSWQETHRPHQQHLLKEPKASPRVHPADQERGRGEASKTGATARRQGAWGARGPAVSRSPPGPAPPPRPRTLVHTGAPTPLMLSPPREETVTKEANSGKGCGDLTALFSQH